MASLKEFLKEQAERQRAESAGHNALRAEWVEAVERLVRQLTEWLEQADQEGVLKIEPQTYEKREEQLGEYKVPGLSIKLGAKEIRVVPLARQVVGAIGDLARFSIKPTDLDEADLIGKRAMGRVDLTDGQRKFMLYRFMNPDGPLWLMIDDEKTSLRRLGREAFEDAIQSLFE